MTFQSNDNLANRELSIEELETIAGAAAASCLPWTIPQCASPLQNPQSGCVADRTSAAGHSKSSLLVPGALRAEKNVKAIKEMCCEINVIHI